MAEPVSCRRCETCNEITPHTKLLGRTVRNTALILAPTWLAALAWPTAAWAAMFGTVMFALATGRKGFRLEWHCERCLHRGHHARVKRRRQETWRRAYSVS